MAIKYYTVELMLRVKMAIIEGIAVGPDHSVYRISHNGQYFQIDRIFQG